MLSDLLCEFDNGFIVGLFFVKVEVCYFILVFWYEFEVFMVDGGEL